MADISSIMVNGHRIGLRGLDQALEDLAAAEPGLGRDAAGQSLLATLAKCNYIPSSAKGDYAAALGRRFASHLGLPVEAERPAGLVVEVLGPGCASCEDLTRRVYQSLERLGIAAEVTHVRDMMEIAARRVMGQPALIVAGEVKAQGAPPTDGDLDRWLTEAAAKLGGR